LEKVKTVSSTKSYSLALSADSPCITAGADSIDISGKMYYYPDSDFEENPRPYPKGTIPDMGAIKVYMAGQA
jgi:hypothetical protein